MFSRMKQYYYQVSEMIKNRRKKKVTPPPAPFPQVPVPKPHPAPAPAPTPPPIPAPPPVVIPPTPPPTPATPPTPSAPSDKIYGITITNPWNQLTAITTALSSMNNKPTARICFDQGQSGSSYAAIASTIHSVAYVMGQCIDSSEMTGYTVDQANARTAEFMNALGSNVDIWEIGNEINGNWLGTTADVVAKMTGSFDLVNNAGKKTALTLYLTDAGPADMMAWVTAHVPARMISGLDQVLVSYYEDDNNNYQPDWQDVMNLVGAAFPNSLIGIGECGTINTANKAAYITRYYKTVFAAVTHPRFIMGNFWWYYDDTDCVPKTKTLWTTLNNLFT